MVVFIALIAAIFAILVWNFFLKESPYSKIEIKESNNISYNFDNIKPVSGLEILNEIEQNEVAGTPVLIHLYTSWCRVCKKQLPVINEIARKFQNTDLNVIFVMIDKNANKELVMKSLDGLENIYFEPQYLNDRGGFKDILKTKSINFKNRIPFTALIGRNSNIIAKFSGYKKEKYIERKIIKSLIKKEDEN